MTDIIDYKSLKVTSPAPSTDGGLMIHNNFISIANSVQNISGDITSISGSISNINNNVTILQSISGSNTFNTILVTPSSLINLPVDTISNASYAYCSDASGGGVFVYKRPTEAIWRRFDTNNQVV